MKKFSAYTWFLFLVLSAIGVFLFITPITTDDGLKVPIAIMANWLGGKVTPVIHWFAFGVFIIAALGSIVMHFVPQKGPRTLLDSLFRVHWFWTVMRVLAVVFAGMYLFQAGPESFISDYTAGLLLTPDGGLVTMMFTLFLFAGLLLPLLTDFGLLEFFGSMMVKIMRPLFKIPGRAAIDCLASWVGDGTIGVLLTAKQYEDKTYAGCYNVGPEECDCLTTGQLAELFCHHWDGARWESRAQENAPHEANFLKLDCTKLKTTFGWQPRWHIRDAIEKTVEWTKVWQRKGDIPSVMDAQIAGYLS